MTDAPAPASPLQAPRERFLAELEAALPVVHDWPKPGIRFYDIAPLMSARPALFGAAVDRMHEDIVRHCAAAQEPLPDLVAGLDARGFVFSSLLADGTRLSCGNLLVRKRGKCPGRECDKYRVEYGLEYGRDAFELPRACMAFAAPRAPRVWIVDDLLATGGSMEAAVKLVRAAGGEVQGCSALIRIGDAGERRLREQAGVPAVLALLHMPGEPAPAPAPAPLCAEEHKGSPTKAAPLPAPGAWRELSADTPSPASLRIKRDAPVVIVAWKTMRALAEAWVQAAPRSARVGAVSWERFADGHHHIGFEALEAYRNRHVVFLGDLRDADDFLAQQQLCISLSRKKPLSLHVVYAYFGPGTMERTPLHGILRPRDEVATAETLAQILSRTLTASKQGPPTVYVFDIHAPVTHFYFNNQEVVYRGLSMIPVLRARIEAHTGTQGLVYCFPDEGAKKRFYDYFSDRALICCSKARRGDARDVTVSDFVNCAPEDAAAWRHVVIVDDLAQSFGSLIECNRALRRWLAQQPHAVGGGPAPRVHAAVVHLVCPGDSFKRLSNLEWDAVYTTDSVPAVAARALAHDPHLFHVEPFLPVLREEILRDSGLPALERLSAAATERRLLLLSCAAPKLRAAEAAFPEYAIRTVSAASGVSAQPLEHETFTGAVNRFRQQLGAGRVNDGPLPCQKRELCLAIENGVDSDGADFAVVLLGTSDGCCVAVSGGRVLLPQEIAQTLRREARDNADANGRRTCGQLLVERGLARDAADWHAGFCTQTRAQILAEGCRLAREAFFGGQELFTFEENGVLL